MWRNREIFIYFSGLFVIGTAAVIIAAFFSDEAALFAGLAALAMIGASFIFTWWRYREIMKLSGYLRKITAGDFLLDVRDNNEGELSILKNEIYKVTKMLSEQGIRLGDEKLALTDAISDISHQLKTPLTSMTMMADLLSKEHLPNDKRVEFTEKIQSQLERIDWLVSSLLKLSKIDAGTANFKKEKISVKELISLSLEPVLVPMDIKEQSLHITGDEQTVFIGDMNWTREALINILKNCVEHTPAGGTISIDFTENPLFTEIIIKDSGDGVPKEDLPYIFKRFYKGKNSSDDSVGIGLAMAHSIITSQNGDITVTSESGEGTKFTIKFYKQIV